MEANPIAYFDADCVLCNAAVDFILRWERDDAIQFAALQSGAGRSAQEEIGAATEGDPSTLIVRADGRLFLRSDAAIRLARHLRWPMRALTLARLLPRPLRDAAYRFVAARRHRWFGRPDVCRVPSPALVARLIDAE